MLQNKLSDIPAIVLLRSDLILRDLIRAVVAPVSKQSLLNNDPFSEAVHAFQPNKFRRSDLDAASKAILSRDYHADYSLDFVDSLFDRYFEFDGSRIFSRHVFADEYSALVKCIHPFTIIGYRMASLLHQGKISLRDVFAYANHATPLGVPHVSGRREYAENHIHLGGANEPHEGLFVLANGNRTREDFYSHSFLKQLPRVTAFPLIMSKHLTLGQMVDYFQEICRAFNGFVLFGAGGIESSLYNLEQIHAGRRRRGLRESGFTLEFFANISPPDDNTLVKKLFGCLLESYRTPNSERSWFLYSVLLHLVHMQKEVPRLIRLYVKIFFHLSNILRSFMVMSQNLGLAHFKEFFDSPVRKNVNNFHRNISRNIIANGTSYLEAKLSPDAVLSGEFYHFMEALDVAISDEATQCVSVTSLKLNRRIQLLEPTTSLVYNDAVPYHFCIHFIRKKDCDNFLSAPQLPPRHFRLREKIEKEARELERILSGGNMKCLSAFHLALKRKGSVMSTLINKKILKDRLLDVTRLFTTLDIAGNEVDAPPEVFAPAIRYLRREVRPIIGTSFVPSIESLHHHGRFRLSVHAGEDFAHIATGLRRIDETVRFYGFRHGDRLGHALALGINPFYWSKRTCDSYLSLEEQFDNVVWLWKLCVDVGVMYPPAVAYAQKCEINAVQLCSRIYGQAFPLQDLYTAWQLRMNCPITYQSRCNAVSWRGDDFSQAVLPNIYRLTEKSTAVEIYERYHFDPSVRQKGGQVLHVRQVEGRVSNDDGKTVTVTEQDLEMFEALQDYLISVYAEMGLVIETNPSSNIYIADIDSYSDHPIFRWNPVKSEFLGSGQRFNRFGLRTGPIKVCINTDDPSIFLTTLQNEFRLIKNAALANFRCCEVEVDQWIEKVRGVGVDVFLDTHLDPNKSEGGRLRLSQ